MVRVMFYTGISVLTVSAALLYLPTCFCYISAAVLSMLFILLLVFRRKIKFNGLKTLVLITLIFNIYGIYVLEYNVKPLSDLPGKTACITGTVWEWPAYNKQYTTYIIKAENISVLSDDGNITKEYKNVKIRVSDVNNSNFDVFQNVKIKVKFNSVNEYKTSSFSNGIYASGYMTEKGIGSNYNRPFYAPFFDLRNYVNKLIFNNISYEEGAVASAVLMGDFNHLDDDFYLNSKITGVTHMLVVSGMHLGIIFQVLGSLTAVLKFPKRIRALVLIFVIFSVAAVCGFTMSILRAGLTYFILAVGMFLHLKPDPLNSLGIAAVIICFTSPFSAGNVAFLLSFLSTFGLIYVCPLMYNKAEKFIDNRLKGSKILKEIFTAICGTLSATVCTMPISVLIFGYISVISVLVNVLVSYAMSLVLVLTLTVVFMLWFPIKIKWVISLVIGLLCLIIRYVVFVVNGIAKVQKAIISTENIYLIPWFILVVAIVLAVIKSSAYTEKSKAQKLKKISAAMLCISLVLFSTFYAVSPKNKICVMSVGKGNCIVLSLEDKTVLIGAGDGAEDVPKIKNTLLTLGKTNIDALILPSLNKSFAGGGAALIREFPNIQVALPRSGDFADKMEYVENEKYSYFDNVCIMPAGNLNQVLIYKDKGVIISFENRTFIINCCDKIGSLLNKDYKNISLICAGKIPEDISKYNFENIIFSGDEKVFENQNIINSKTAENSFSNSVEFNFY